MNNAAFRELLTANKTTAATNSRTRSFGSTLKRNTNTTAVTNTNTTPSFKPRNQSQQRHKSRQSQSESTATTTTTGGGTAYRDRAADRRLGKDHEFTQVEKVLEDFNARTAETPLTKQDLEQQLKYLGGDAEHSVLVKGLDFALADSRRLYPNSNSNSSSSGFPTTEAELDAQLDLALTAPEEFLLAATATAAASSSSTLNSTSATLGKKRTRDELLSELKASRAQGVVDDPMLKAELEQREREKEKVGLGKGFKPIGFDARQAKLKNSTSAASSSSTSKGEKKSIGKDGKARRKKVKVSQDNVVGTVAVAGSSKQKDSIIELRAPVATLADEDDDDDDDIFGGAVEYKGIASDSDEDASTPSLPLPLLSTTTTPTKKRSYFESNDSDSDSAPQTQPPSSLSHLARETERLRKKRTTHAEYEEGDQDEDDEGGGGGQVVIGRKLQGLSGGNTLDVRTLLEMDSLAEKEEKRIARKLHFAIPKEGDEKVEKVLTEAARFNKDYQQLQNYMVSKGSSSSSSRQPQKNDRPGEHDRDGNQAGAAREERGLDSD